MLSLCTCSKLLCFLPNIPNFETAKVKTYTLTKPVPCGGDFRSGITKKLLQNSVSRQGRKDSSQKAANSGTFTLGDVTFAKSLRLSIYSKIYNLKSSIFNR